MLLGKVLGAIVGFAAGLAIHGVAAALVLAVIGLVLGQLYDGVHAPPPPEPLPEDGTRFGERERGHRAQVPPARPFVASASEGSARSSSGFAVEDAEDTPPDFKRRSELESVARARFARRLCELFVEVARADGDVVGEEVRVVRQFFAEELQFTPSELDLVRGALKTAIARPAALEQVITRAHDELSLAERQLLMNALYELALADGGLKRSESDTIRRIARGLEISADELRAIASRHLGEGESHYATLGLNADCSDDELRSAFRKLASTHHPDKVAHLGPNAVELASRRFHEIKDAYEELRRIRGL